MGLVCVDDLGLLGFDGFDFLWVCVLMLSMEEGICLCEDLICAMRFISNGFVC